MGFFEVDGLMEAATATAHARAGRPGSPGSRRWSCSARRDRAVRGARRAGARPHRRAAGGAGRRAHRAEAGRDRAARAQRRRRSGAGRAGDRERRLRRVHASRTTRSAGSAASEIDVDYPWIEGENYEVLLLTATGATIDHAIDAAVETPDADLGFYGLMALIGLYVGVIPVAIGMLWLPWLRGVDARWIGFLLAFTVGLLGFLGIEALLEGTEIAGTGAEALRGRGARLAGRGGRLPRARGRGRAGCAGGAARGGRREGGGRSAAAGLPARPSWWRSASACTTWARGSRSARPTRSGRWRSAPRWWSASRSTTPPRASRSWRRSRASGGRSLGRLALLGLLAGAPAVLGAWIGASAFNPSLAALMFGIGAGAIAQVIVQIAPADSRRRRPPAAPARRGRPAHRPRRDVRDRPAGVASDGRHARRHQRDLERRPGLREGDLVARAAQRRAGVDLGDRRAARGLAGVRVGDGQAARVARPRRRASRTTACSSRERASAWRSRCCATTGCSSSTSPRRSACPGTACTRRPRCSSTRSRPSSRS